jgi:hypothetical protein
MIGRPNETAYPTEPTRALTVYLVALLYAIGPTMVHAAVTSTLAATAISGCYFPALQALGWIRP